MLIELDVWEYTDALKKVENAKKKNRNQRVIMRSNGAAESGISICWNARFSSPFHQQIKTERVTSNFLICAEIVPTTPKKLEGLTKTLSLHEKEAGKLWSELDFWMFSNWWPKKTHFIDIRVSLTTDLLVIKIPRHEQNKNIWPLKKCSYMLRLPACLVIKIAIITKNCMEQWKKKKKFNPHKAICWD